MHIVKINLIINVCFKDKSANLALSMTQALDKMTNTSTKEDIIEASNGIVAAIANAQEVS